MKAFALGIPLALTMLAITACADEPYTTDAPPPPPEAVQQQQAPTYTQEQLDQMLAPIALYPDSLLTQILMASTYPLEVVEAARWSQAHPGLQGNAAVMAIQNKNWDPSVKSLVAFPQLLSMMNDKLDWTEGLGDAFLAQQAQVMSTVQGLRQRAYEAGNLRSDQQIQVEQPQPQTIVIETVQPDVVYVPYYDPVVAYGGWWWPDYPPVFWNPWPGYYYHPGFAFGWGGGIVVGRGFFFGGCDWYHRNVVVVNQNNYYYRNSYAAGAQFNNGGNWSHYSAKANTPGGGAASVWQHDPGHRRGVPYPTAGLTQQFSRVSTAPGARGGFGGNNAARPFGSVGPFHGNNNWNNGGAFGSRNAGGNTAAPANTWQRNGFNGNGGGAPAPQQSPSNVGQGSGREFNQPRPAAMEQPHAESAQMPPQPQARPNMPQQGFNRPAPAPRGGGGRPARGGGGGNRGHR